MGRPPKGPQEGEPGGDPEESEPVVQKSLSSQKPTGFGPEPGEPPRRTWLAGERWEGWKPFTTRSYAPRSGASFPTQK